MWGLILILAGLPLAGWAGAEDLQISDAHVAASKAGGSAAVSMLIQNPGAAAVVITGARSAVAGQTQVQQYVKDQNGLVQLKPVTELTVPAKGEVVIAPGALELRLIGLRQDLEAGLEIPLTFKFSNGELRTVRVDITDQ